MTQDKIAARIRALLAKAAGTNNEHEAAAFAAKAHEMLAQHNLELADVAAADAGTVRVVEHAIDDPYLDPWRVCVYTGVAELYFCGLFRHWFVRQSKRPGVAGKMTRGMTFVGREHCVEIAASMAEYLIGTTIRLSREYSSDRASQLGFQRGCGMRLYQRLTEMAVAAKAGSGPITSPESGTALALVYSQDAQAVSEHLATKSLKAGRATRISLSGGAAAAGRAAGSSVSLAAQVGVGSRQKRITQ